MQFVSEGTEAHGTLKITTQLYAKKSDKLNEMNKFLELHILPKLTQKETFCSLKK